MAIRYAITSGSWSNPAIWDGGTLPTTGDDVYSNNFRVIIDVPTIDAAILTNGSNVSPAINSGGGFTTSVNCDISSSINWNNASNLVTTNKLLITSGSTTVNLSGTINGGTGTSATSSPIVEVLSGSVLNYTGGELINTTTALSPLFFIFIDCYGTANINANVTSFNGGSNGNLMLVLRSTGIMTINGNITQRNVNSGGIVIHQQANTSLTINGNLVVNTSVPFVTITTLDTNNDTILNFNGSINFTAAVGLNPFINTAQNARLIVNMSVNQINRITNQGVNISIRRGTVNLVGNFIPNDIFTGNLIGFDTTWDGNIPTNVICNIIGNFKGSFINPQLSGIQGNGFFINTPPLNCVFNITGNAEGGDGFATDDRFANAGISNVNSSCIIQGEIVAIASPVNRNPGIISFNSSNVFIKRAITGPAPNYTAPYRGTIRFNTTAPEIQVSKQDNTVATLSDPALQDYPSINDVRDGVEYGFLSYEGTLSVPLPSQVSLGTPIDNTVGTGIVTSNDFLEAIKTSSDPLAERLRNVATVQTVGDQFNSF